MYLDKFIESMENKYKCDYWHKYGKYRLYFTHKKRFAIFLELKIINNKIVEAIPDYRICKNRYNLSQKWIHDHVDPYWAYVNRVACEATLIIESIDFDITLDGLSKRTIIKRRDSIRN